MHEVLILGGYGNFGARIATSLLKNGISIVIVGRHLPKSQRLQNELIASNASYEKLISIAAFDANQDDALDQAIIQWQPKIIVNTIGPFQTANYNIVTTCIRHGIHYIDLADARDFVVGITQFDDMAKSKNALVVSGASTVPGLSSAVIEFYRDQFEVVDTLRYGITPGQKAPRGLATTESILTYLGKPLRAWEGQPNPRFGWQDIYRQEYPELGKRWMANCEIPDLDLFPIKYNIRNIQFSAGMESTPLHIGMWLVSHLVSMGLPLNLHNHAQKLLSFSHVFDFLGSDAGGMHMMMQGKNKQGKYLEIKWFIIAKDNDGPQIPCVPAIVLCKKLLHEQLKLTGAMPCVGLITLPEYLQALQGFNIKTVTEINEIESSKTSKNKQSD